MLFSIAGIFGIIALFTLIIVFIAFGQWVGKTRPKKPGLDITEGAVFTLMALLVAFMFSSAGLRFDQRRFAVIDEVNAIGTAYLRLDMLKDKDREILQNDFRSWIAARLAIYRAVPDFAAVDREYRNSKNIQAKLWSDAVAACKQSTFFAAPMLILPAINTMFDIASTRMAFTLMHPHFLIFGLLILVVLISAFLTGYGIVDRGAWGSLHVITFAIVTALTIYIVIDLEFPRLGNIQENEFDSLLVAQQMSMAAASPVSQSTGGVKHDE